MAGSSELAGRQDRGAPGCIGIDVGGTFTDAVLSRGTQVVHAKVPTTPDDMSRGVLQVCAALAGRCGTRLDTLLASISRFGVSTTAVTNVLAQRSGRPVGLITTRGFEAAMPLAKGRRVHDADGWLVLPAPVVRPEWIAGVAERVDRNGTVLQAVSADEVQAAARRLVEDQQVEAIVVSFLWAFRNPVNERVAAAAVRHLFPELPVTEAGALTPIIREFERTSVAVLNAYVMNAVAGLDELQARLSAAGLRVPMLIMHSGGGAASLAESRHFPLSLTYSGPAAGVAAAALVAATAGAPEVLACDMGGTSFEVAVVAGDVPRRSRGELLDIWTALSMVDVLSIGAGGGSIGWIDARRVLRVGPRSAGAVPGPACYARGGDEATVTDALVVLGYLDPARFLGGTMPLEVELAHAACARLGDQLNLGASETAWGIRELATEEMTRAVRSVISARGIDPRRYPLLSYGGAAGLFAAEIASAIGAPRVLVPERASILSAFGCAATDVVRERVCSLAVPLVGNEALVQRTVEALRAEVLADLAADGVATADRAVRVQSDLRFERQIWELNIALPDDPGDPAALARLADEFRAEYSRVYGHGVLAQGATVELVNLRAIGTGRTVTARIEPKTVRVPEGTRVRPAGVRRVRRGRDAGDESGVPCVNQVELQPGHVLAGPLLIDAADTTIWLPPAWQAKIDHFGTCVMEPRQ